MHCKSVSVRDVSAPLTEEGVSRLMADWTAYAKTELVVLRNGGCAVVSITGSEGAGLLRRVSGFEILSLPGDTVYVRDPSADVLNAPAMARVQASHPGKTVVVEGMFSHINVVRGLAPLRLRVVDCAPPRPSKLSVLVKAALDSGFVDLPVVHEVVELDFAEAASRAGGGAMLPCRASGLSDIATAGFLDDPPADPGGATVVGCKLSARVFRAIYGRDAPLINMCPFDGAPRDGVKSIARCCDLKEGHEICGDVAKVPWGATVPEVAGAIAALFSE
ncbi:MAG: hypothetical protein LBG62_06285 [Candidatus Methanoplasma sp.]|jgi:hypothetical protein|nr:hypothetical protein [Candidatus Methanoplasma sp.]